MTTSTATRLVVPLTGAGLSCAYLFELESIPSWQASFYPTVVSLLALVVCGIVAVREYLARQPDAGVASSSGQGWRRFRPDRKALLVLLTAGLIAAMPIVGVLLASWGFIVGYRLLIRSAPLRVLAVELLLVVLFVISAIGVLYIPLPTGALEVGLMGIIR